MRTFSKAVLSVVAVLAVVSLAVGSLQAQERQREQRQRRGQFRSGGPGASVLFLLRSQQVQEELKLTDEQKEELEKFLGDQAAALGKLQDQELDRQERQGKLRELRKKFDSTVAKILKEEQQKRLGQIQLQVQSRSGMAQVFARGPVARKLEITSDQRQKIRAIAQETRKARTDLREQAQQKGANRREVFQKIRQLGEKEREQVLAVLSDEQQEEWKEMLGKPFELQRERRRRQRDR